MLGPSSLPLPERRLTPLSVLPAADLTSSPLPLLGFPALQLRRLAVPPLHSQAPAGGCRRAPYAGVLRRRPRRALDVRLHRARRRGRRRQPLWPTTSAGCPAVARRCWRPAGRTPGGPGPLSDPGSAAAAGAVTANSVYAFACILRRLYGARSAVPCISNAHPIRRRFRWILHARTSSA